MSKFTTGQFKNGINRTLDDTGDPFIRCGSIAACGWYDWLQIRAALSKWQNDGFLRIIQDPEEAKPLSPCVEMFSYIDMKSPTPGFLNWESDGGDS